VPQQRHTECACYLIAQSKSDGILCQRGKRPMLVNANAVLDGFITALRLVLGLVVIGLGVAAVMR
jgi:hypothetical protein